MNLDFTGSPSASEYVLVAAVVTLTSSSVLKYELVLAVLSMLDDA